MKANYKAAKKRMNELNAKLITKNDQVMNLTRENKGLRHSLDRMKKRCRFLKEVLLVREKQLFLKNRQRVDGDR